MAKGLKTLLVGGAGCVGGTSFGRSSQLIKETLDSGRFTRDFFDSNLSSLMVAL